MLGKVKWKSVKLCVMCSVSPLAYSGPSWDPQGPAPLVLRPPFVGRFRVAARGRPTKGEGETKRSVLEASLCLWMWTYTDKRRLVVACPWVCANMSMNTPCLCPFYVRLSTLQKCASILEFSSSLFVFFHYFSLVTFFYIIPVWNFANSFLIGQWINAHIEWGLFLHWFLI